MPTANQTIEFEGYFAEGVLGIFKIIRGFADLRDLAAISVPYELNEGPEVGRVVGHQRQLNEKHALDIKKYLEQSDNRLIPEIILSVRGVFNNVTEQERVVGVGTGEGALIAVSRRFAGKHQRVQQIRIQHSDLEAVKEQKMVRRIDGNHRLAMAETLEPFAALADILTRLTFQHPSLCQTYAFLELAARVWRESTGNTHDERVNAAVSLLDRIGLWLGAEGITSLLDPLSPAKQLLETFKAAQQRVPKRVFLARWYPSQEAKHNAFNKANLRLQQLKETLSAIERDHKINLELIDMGTEEGGAFPIHHRMYEAIASSDIIICDLTGQRPNVFVEAGFALKHHEKNRLIFLFEPRNRNDKVPFDLTTFKYVTISQAAEIPNKVKTEIVAILRDTGAPN